MGLESQVIGLLIIAVFVAATARRFRMPYTVAMVLTGLVVGLLRLPPEISYLELDSHLILVTFLPGLIFEAAFHIDLRQFRDNLRTIVILAVPGVIISSVIIGLLLNQLLPFTLTEALLFGVLISATDPIAVVALFKELGVDRRLGVIVEGESLFNDGAAIVMYSILLGVATGEQPLNLTQGIVTFFVTVAGGVVLGLIVGLIFGELMKRTDDHLLDIALTTILAYGTYLLAEEVLHAAVSPVIAVVVAAIYVGNYGSRGGYSATSQVTIISFWEFVSFLLNSAIFLLIGLEVEPSTLVSHVGPVLIGIGVILLARGLVIFPLRYIVNLSIRPLPARWGPVLFWGGLRGAVSTALVLSLPSGLASRELMEVMAFGYILFSLIIQGLTVRPLLNRLGLTHVSDKRLEFEKRRAEIAMSQAAIEALDELRDDHVLTGPICDQLHQVFNEQIDEKRHELDRLIASDPSLSEENVRLVQSEISIRQKQALLKLLRRGVLSDEVFVELSGDLDERYMRMSEADWHPRSLLIHGPEVFLPNGSDETGTPPSRQEKPEIFKTSPAGSEESAHD